MLHLIFMWSIEMSVQQGTKAPFFSFPFLFFALRAKAETNEVAGQSCLVAISVYQPAGHCMLEAAMTQT